MALTEKMVPVRGIVRRIVKRHTGRPEYQDDFPLSDCEDQNKYTWSRSIRDVNNVFGINITMKDLNKCETFGDVLCFVEDLLGCRAVDLGLEVAGW